MYSRCGTDSELILAEIRGFKEAKGKLPTLLSKLDPGEARR